MQRTTPRQQRRVPATPLDRLSRRHQRGGTARERTPQETQALPAERSDGGMKLLLIIVSDADADGLVRAMIARGYPATKIGTTGGFLRRGNTTIFSGVQAAAVDEVIALVQQLCPPRTELLAMSALPLAGDMPFLNEPIEVRAGGAVVFVLAVSRFERI